MVQLRRTGHVPNHAEASCRRTGRTEPMKLIHLSPGAGDNFYCENCLRDVEMVLALRRMGHEASCVPLYLPLMTDAGIDERARGEVFFGGINVFLQQHSAVFRHTPRWLDRLFDARWLLRWAGRKAGMTSAREVGETMLSMLQGRHGRQVKELQRLVTFLADQQRPDVVSLSNVLLVGLVGSIKRALGVPVVCSLQDEEGYVDTLPEPYRSRAWDVLRERCREVDAFVAPSRFYGAEMRRRLDLPADRVHVIPDAIDPSAFAPAPAPPDPPAVGFLSQMCAGKGLDTLVDAFCRLKQSGRWDELKLRVFGGQTAADEPFVQAVRRRLDEAHLAAAVEFQEGFEPARKLAFLQSCSVVSVPTRQGEAFGLFALEALACGVPVVLPDHGAFPELIDATGGGLLCRPNDPAHLAETLETLLADEPRRAELGRAGRQAVIEKYNADRMAENVWRICERLVPAATDS